MVHDARRRASHPRLGRTRGQTLPSGSSNQILLLDMNPKAAAERGAYGEERCGWTENLMRSWCGCLQLREARVPNRDPKTVQVDQGPHPIFAVEGLMFSVFFEDPLPVFSSQTQLVDAALPPDDVAACISEATDAAIESLPPKLKVLKFWARPHPSVTQLLTQNDLGLQVRT